MKTLVILCSPKRNGNTAQLAEAFRKEILKSNNHCNIIYLNNKLKPCQECNACRKPPYQCVQNDSWHEIYSEFSEADVVVFASPIFFYTFSSQMKIFIDRMYPLFSNHNLEYSHKKAVLMMTAADREPEVFQSAVEYYEKIIIRRLGFEDVGRLLVPGFSTGGDKEKTLENAVKAARDLGADLSKLSQG